MMASLILAGAVGLVPPRAVELMPQMQNAIEDIWPGIPMRSYVPAQIEQETCITLTHKFCFNSKAELKTDREYGFGIAQFTIAYRADKTVRFNAWEEVKAQHPSLKDWAWEDRYNPEKQIKGLVVKNWINWKSIHPGIKDPVERMAFTASTYNGGSTVKDRQLCAQTPRCNPNKWFSTGEELGVEAVSFKSRIPHVGYRKSFYEINREYVRNVIFLRRQKYIHYLGS